MYLQKNSIHSKTTTADMYNRLFYLMLFMGWGYAAQSQKAKPDADSTDYYNDLFSELDHFMDSILAPRTMVLVNVGVTSTYLNYETKTNFELESKQKLSYSPSLGYFHKDGLGVNLTSLIVNDNKKLNAYQFITTASYDYLKDEHLSAGLNFSHFFTKKILPFYTSPLQNELGGYFTYRKWWVKPSLVARYGWGNRTSEKQRETYITSLRLRPYGFTRINSKESISDFAISLSARHDFYWLNAFGNRSLFRVSPQLSFTSGTQKFGLNESSNTYGTLRRRNTTVLYRARNNYLDSRLFFQPISAAAFIKTELSFGKFFIQPQVAFNYFFPATDKHFSSLFTLNMGVIF